MAGMTSAMTEVAGSVVDLLFKSDRPEKSEIDKGHFDPPRVGFDSTMVS